VNASSHIPDIRFDAKGLVANAGLALPATLARHLGLPDLLRRHVRLGSVDGAANPDVKGMTVIASLLAGGEWIDDVGALRAGRVGHEVLGVAPAAASTVGTFLRAFTAGHVRQLDAVQEDLHQRAWDAGARPAGATLKLDLDSTVIETYGLQKQGGKHFTYLNTRGYHPLLAVLAETGEVVHSRLREGKASAGRGAANFARQALVRLGRLGSHQEVVVRADSGFYSEKVVRACEAHGARFSISVRLQKSHHDLIDAIPEEDWQRIPYWLDGAADVAEVPYRPFGKKQTYRLIVRRVAPAGKPALAAGAGLQLLRLPHRPGGRDAGAGGGPPAARGGRERDPRPQARAGAQPHAERQVRGQRGLAGAERDRPQPLLLARTAGRLRRHLPEGLAASFLRPARTPGPARPSAAAAAAGGLALAGTVPDAAGPGPGGRGAAHHLTRGTVPGAIHHSGIRVSTHPSPRQMTTPRRPRTSTPRSPRSSALRHR
jgi:hypothetical protein